MNLKMFNKIGFIVIIIVYFSLLVYKAATFPVSNDETPTAIIYINYNVWEIMMYPDSWPNNHILNTLCTKLFVSVFGNEQLVIRMPALLSFLIFSLAIFRINKLVLKVSSVFFLPVALFFISNPYMLDFFGLGRGYAMSWAFATLSLSFLVEGYYFTKDKSIWLALLFSILASYAHFTLLVYWCAISFFAWFYFFSKSGTKISQLIAPTLIIALVTFLYLALIANPLIKIHQADELRYWTSNGFYRETIYMLIELSRSGSKIVTGGNSHVIAVLIFIVIIINSVYVFYWFRKSNYKITSLKQPVFVMTFVLLITAAINIMQCSILGTPNLTGRTALFFYPLFIATFAGLLSLIPEAKAKLTKKVAAFLFAFICIYHVADKYKLNWVREWWFDDKTFEVLNYIKPKEPGETVSLQTFWFYYNSFAYYSYTGKTPWLRLYGYDQKINPDSEADFYYVFAENYKVLEPKYEIALKLKEDQWLLKRKTFN